MCTSEQGELGLGKDPLPGKCRKHGCHLTHSENCFHGRVLVSCPVHELSLYQNSFLARALFLSHELWDFGDTGTGWSPSLLLGCVVIKALITPDNDNNY